MSTEYTGTYRGVVTNIKDTEGHRRIKCKVPQLFGDSELNWAWPLETSSLKTQVPDVGEGVWIAFEGGDPGYPIWSGNFGKPKTGKRVNVKVLADSVSLTGLTPYFKTERTANGTTEIDLVATLLAMAATLKDHQSRIVTLESKVATLETQMTGKASTSHSHS